MDSRLVQFKVGKNDELLYDLVNRLNEHGKEQRGYVSDQLRKRLTVYEVLAEMVDEDEPMRLLAKISNCLVKMGTATEDHTPREENKPKQADEELDSSIADFVNSNNY